MVMREIRLYSLSLSVNAIALILLDFLMGFQFYFAAGLIYYFSMR